MTKDEARAVCEIVKSRCGDKGFALFVQGPDDSLNYMSNCERESVVETLIEWLQHTRGQSASKRAQAVSRGIWVDPDPFAGFERIKLERLCISIGEEIEEHGKVALFLMDMGDGGHLAHHSNMPYVRHNITTWVEAMLDG
jgi:hypothetical protein